MADIKDGDLVEVTFRAKLEGSRGWRNQIESNFYYVEVSDSVIPGVSVRDIITYLHKPHNPLIDTNDGEYRFITHNNKAIKIPKGVYTFKAKSIRDNPGYNNLVGPVKKTLKKNGKVNFEYTKANTGAGSQGGGTTINEGDNITNNYDTINNYITNTFREQIDNSRNFFQENSYFEQRILSNLFVEINKFFVQWNQIQQPQPGEQPVNIANIINIFNNITEIIRNITNNFQNILDDINNLNLTINNLQNQIIQNYNNTVQAIIGLGQFLQQQQQQVVINGPGGAPNVNVNVNPTINIPGPAPVPLVPPVNQQATLTIRSTPIQGVIISSSINPRQVTTDQNITQGVAINTILTAPPSDAANTHQFVGWVGGNAVPGNPRQINAVVNLGQTVVVTAHYAPIRNPNPPPVGNKRFELKWVIVDKRKTVHKIKEGSKLPENQNYVLINETQIAANLDESKRLQMTPAILEEVIGHIRRKKFNFDDIYLCLGAREVDTEKPWRWDSARIKKIAQLYSIFNAPIDMLKEFKKSVIAIKKIKFENKIMALSNCVANNDPYQSIFAARKAIIIGNHINHTMIRAITPQEYMNLILLVQSGKCDLEVRDEIGAAGIPGISGLINTPANLQPQIALIKTQKTAVKAFDRIVNRRYDYILSEIDKILKELTQGR